MVRLVIWDATSPIINDVTVMQNGFPIWGEKHGCFHTNQLSGEYGNIYQKGMYQ